MGQRRLRSSNGYRGQSQSNGVQNLRSALRREIARRKRVEAALRKSEEYYCSMVEMQSELVCRYLPDTTLTFVNDAYCRYFGKKRGELVGKSFLTLLPAEANEAVRDHVRALCEDRKPMSTEHEVIGPDGQLGWQRWEDRVILNEDGSIHELQAVGRDITKEKQAEESLRRKQQELSRLLEHYERLTPREREVMTLVVEGQLNKEIAAKTGITERTIKFHRRQIMERMQARSLAELVRMAEKLEGLNGRY